MSVIVTDAVAAEMYCARRAVLALLMLGIVMENFASARGPVYGAAALADVGAGCGNEGLRELPPPHAARDAASVPAIRDGKTFLRNPEVKRCKIPTNQELANIGTGRSRYRRSFFSCFGARKGLRASVQKPGSFGL